MRIGTIIKEYRSIHKLSMEKFAELAGKSKGYISMLEKGENPNTKKPISPSLETLQNIASAMNMDFDILVSQLDDNQLISNSTTLSAYSDFLTQQTTDKIENIQDISHRIRELRLANNLEQTEVADYLGYKSDTTVSKWENGKNLPTGAKLAKLAALFNTTTDYILHGKDITPTASPDLLTQQINDKVVQLTQDNKKIVLRTSEELLESQRTDGGTYRQKNEEETKINEVSEKIISLDDYRQTTYRRVTGVVSAGSGAMQDDDLDMEVSFYEDEIPDNYDAIAYVVGNSMEPKIKNGDYLFIKATPQVDYNTIGIFQVDGANYVKKLRQGYLESLNPDYEDIHLDESNYIRIIGEVVSIYREK